MISRQRRYFQSDDSKGVLVLLVIGLAVGFAIGGSVVGKQKEESAVQWALRATAECEKTYEGEGYSSVTECLEFAIWAVEDEIRASQSEDGRDAGR